MHDPALLALAVTVALALVFDFINGFHDTANTIATSIATRALTMRAALVVSALFNFIGAFASHKVALTIATGIASPAFMDMRVIAAALSGAIAWNLITWFIAMPSSSSHALIAALFGAAAMKAALIGSGFSALNFGELLKIVLALLTSPLLGLAAAFVVFKLVALSARAAGAGTLRTNRVLARMQILSAALSSFSHGSNDAQKTMGIITVALYNAGYADSISVPTWVTISCAMAISLGVMTGGWRIMRTVARKITSLQPSHGFSAEVSSAAVILGASFAGMPVSTTHVAVSAVVGVGASKTSGRMSRGVVLSLAYAWITTIPASAAVAATAYLLFSSSGIL